MKLNAGLCLVLLFLPYAVLPAQETADQAALSSKTREEQQLDTIHYGTETEIAALIDTLRGEGADYLDDELATLVKDTHNRSILTGVFSFFGERSRGGLEERARRAIEERDDEANETVLGAVEYAGKLKDPEAIPLIQELLDAEERRFMGAAFRALGRIGGGNAGSADDVAAYLIDYYTNRNPGDENRRDIIVAVGETGSKQGVSFLTDITGNNDERGPVRMAALESLAKIGDTGGLRAILDNIASQDPNIRSAAVAALGPFSGSEVEQAILEAFRDSYWRTRVSAAQAAKARKLEAAVPYLVFRAERDDVPNVKNEAVRALGAIGNGEARTALDKLFSEQKNPAPVRILSAEMLVELDGDAYAEKVIAELDNAKRKNQTALYNGLLKAISAAKTGKVEGLASRFLNSGGAVEKSSAMDMIANNRFTGLAAQVQALMGEKNGGLARKARTTLEKLGQSSSSQ